MTTIDAALDVIGIGIIGFLGCEAIRYNTARKGLERARAWYERQSNGLSQMISEYQDRIISVDQGATAHLTPGIYKEVPQRDTHTQLCGGCGKIMPATEIAKCEGKNCVWYLATTPMADRK